MFLDIHIRHYFSIIVIHTAVLHRYL